MVQTVSENEAEISSSGDESQLFTVEDQSSKNSRSDSIMQELKLPFRNSGSLGDVRQNYSNKIEGA